MIGDEVYLTEETYQSKVGSLVMTVELLAKRLAMKDEAIAEKDKRIAELEGKLSKKGDKE